MPKILEWAKSHPLETGGIVFVGGLGALYFLGFFSSGSSSGNAQATDDTAAYYAAESAQAQAGDELQAVQIQSNAATAQTALNDAATVSTNDTWASTNLATTQSNNATSIALAPYQVQETAYNDLAAVASQPPVVTTTTSSNSSSGFFGIGAGSSTSTNQTVSPNQAADTSAELLGELVSNGFNASS